MTLFAEITYNSGEESYSKKDVIKKSNYVIALLSVVGILVWFFIGIKAISDINSIAVAIVWLTTSILGICVSVFLLWYEIDTYNPIVQQFCSSGKKVNCNAVLGSKESKVLFGIFNWSEIGFAYFTACFFLLLIRGQEVSSILILGNLSILSIPVIVISIYYQAIQIKQFCLMCLLIQLLLTINVFATILTGYYSLSANILDIAIFVSFLGLSLWSWRMLKPIFLNSKQKISSQRNFNKLKNNPNVLLGLLQGSDPLINSTEGLGITVGKSDAPYKVIKVCNPYCPPCAAAHPVLEELVRRNLVQLQIIFTSTAEIHNQRALPTRHLMALSEQNDEKLIHKALDDWYLPKEKDYKKYAQQYPLNGEIAQQTQKIKAMRDWCDIENITHTPTIYINGYQLPKEYFVNDLIDVIT